MSIQINITAQSAVELTQLIKDLSTSLSGTKVETPAAESAGFVAQAAPAVSTVPVQQAHQAYQAQQQYTPPAQQQTAPPYAPPAQPPYTPPTQTQQPPAQPPQAPQQPTVPTTAPQYTPEMLGTAAGPLVEAGRGPELIAWLNQRGAASLGQLDKAHYGEFATYLRGLGAKI